MFIRKYTKRAKYLKNFFCKLTYYTILSSKLNLFKKLEKTFANFIELFSINFKALIKIKNFEKLIN